MKRFAPRYTISIRYEPFELFTQGEYFVDAAIHAENFSIAGRNSVARPQAGSELASSWIGPKRSAVNSTFLAGRWLDSNIKKSILQHIGSVPVQRRPRLFCHDRKFLSDGLITMFLAFGFSIAWIDKISA